MAQLDTGRPHLFVSSTAQLDTGEPCFWSDWVQVKVVFSPAVYTIHRQNVEVTNAEWTQRRTTKRRMGQNAECQNVE